jgi:hypothetical protein
MERMEKQTAVIYAQELINIILYYLDDDELERINDVFEKAKEMEKHEQMYTYDELRQIAYNAYCKGQLDGSTEGKFNFWIQQFKKK